MLILLKNIIERLKIPTKIPTNDRLRWFILYTGLYHIRINESVYLCLARAYRLTIYIIITLMIFIFRLFNYF